MADYKYYIGKHTLTIFYAELLRKAFFVLIFNEMCTVSSYRGYDHIAYMYNKYIQHIKILCLEIQNGVRRCTKTISYHP